jgi:hypothetical protein
MRAVLLSRSIRHIGANHASHRQNKTVKLPTRLNHFATLLVLCPLLAVADPEAELREAVSALSQTSYTWETTTRQRFTGDTTEPRINPNAPIEVRGRIDPAGYTEMTFMPSRDLPVPVTTLARDADVLAHTPVGWMRRSEMRQTAAADREVSFEGKTVRLSRFFTVALKATAQRTLTENLIDLITDLKSVRSESGLIIAELRDRTVEQLWADAQAKRAPEIQGTVIFKLVEQGLAEIHVVIAIGFPNSRTKKTSWSMQQWTTRITGIGSTRVEPPAEAVKVLDQ